MEQIDEQIKSEDEEAFESRQTYSETSLEYLTKRSANETDVDTLTKLDLELRK